MNAEEIIRAHYAKIGAMKSPAGIEASKRNLRKALEKTSAPVEKLEEAYQAVKAKRTTPSRAAVEIAKCGYDRLKDYMKRRKKETPEQIRDNPRAIKRKK